MDEDASCTREVSECVIHVLENGANNNQEFILQVPESADQDPAISDQEISITDSSATVIVDNDSMHDDGILVGMGQTTDESNCLLNDSKRGKAVERVDVSQNWFTSKTDKRTLQDQGHRWKQGQWSAEENDILRVNINNYCQSKGIQDPNSIIFDMSKDMRKDFYRIVARGLSRPLFSVYRRVLRMYDKKNHIGKYTPEEIAILRKLREEHGNDWSTIGAALGRSAGSVRDRCRLMKDSCRYGTWQHDEEMRLASAVYELSGAQPGEEVHHGLSWSEVAAKVKTRSEKQCRAKWLNVLNWKQKGGSEWKSPYHDYILLEKIKAAGVTDEAELDWGELAKGWDSVRSPQWLRSKWWALKRHVPYYNTIPFTELLDSLTLLQMTGTKLRPNDKNASKLIPFRLAQIDGETVALLPHSIELSTDGSPTSSLGDSITDTSNAVHTVTTSTGTYFLTQSSNGALSASSNDCVFVQAVPINELSCKLKTESTSYIGNSSVETISPPQAHDSEIVILEEDMDSVVGVSSSSQILVSETGEELVDSGTSDTEALIHLSSLSDPLLNSHHNDLGSDN